MLGGFFIVLEERCIPRGRAGLREYLESIGVSEYDPFEIIEKTAETSSKGNQEKWLENGRWYKLDQFGYEALAETVISMLLEYSSIEQDTPFSFTRYRIERMNVHGRERTGCSSENFLKPGQSIITLSHSFKRHEREPLGNILSCLPSDKRRIAYLAEATADFTGLKEFPRYLTLLFEVDALFGNDDRHLNNIAVLQQSGVYDYCPIFDNGAGLLSNVQVSRMDIALRALISELIALPFKTIFNRQMNTARKLYGTQLHITKFSRNQIKEILEPILEFYAERDRGILSDRVCDMVMLRQRFVSCT